MLEDLEIHNISETLVRPDGSLILYSVVQPAREFLNHVAYERNKIPTGPELSFVPRSEITITLERVVSGWDPQHTVIKVQLSDHQHTTYSLPPGRSSLTARSRAPDFGKPSRRVSSIQLWRGYSCPLIPKRI